jgi:hypothetical protein
MKIGINLVGVSYNDGLSGGRYRNFEDAKDGFFKYVVNPLKEQGHEIFFYIFSYDNSKKEEIINTYLPLKKVIFIPEEVNFNKCSSGDKLPNGVKLQSATYCNSLVELLEEDLDLVISTRFDINFFKNPFEEYNYNFDKCNFLWREPEYLDLPIVNDTFIVFPHFMTNNLIEAIMEMEHNPPNGCNVAMHNLYLPMVNQVGKYGVQWLDDDYKNTISNDLYKLTRHE